MSENNSINEYVQQRKQKQKKNKIKRILAVVLATLLLILFSVGGIFYARLMRAEKAIHQKVETVNLRKEEIKDTDSFSVLLLGLDNGAYGRPTDVARSDSMLLVTVNEKLGKTTIVSIPRDSYTEIVGYGMNDKINHAYAYGREEMSINSVQNMLNIPIDYYVTINMGGLMELVDAIGGIEITPALSFVYEGEAFQEGVTRQVEGEAALRYARMRYDDPDGDTGRQRRQQYVIQQIVKKLLTLSSVTKYEEILKTVEKNVRTNFTLEKLVSIKQNYPKALTHFEQDTITGEGVMINGIYYFAVNDTERVRIANVLRENLELEKITTLKHIETQAVQTTPIINETTVPATQPAFAEPERYVEPTVQQNQNANTSSSESVEIIEVNPNETSSIKPPSNEAESSELPAPPADSSSETKPNDSSNSWNSWLSPSTPQPPTQPNETNNPPAPSPQEGR